MTEDPKITVDPELDFEINAEEPVQVLCGLSPRKAYGSHYCSLGEAGSNCPYFSKNSVALVQTETLHGCGLDRNYRFRDMSHK